MPKTRSILFVCLGNIVRSPLAENLFLHLQPEYTIDPPIEVDSAGTSSWHVGEGPDPRMVRKAAQHGVENDGRSRRVRRQDFNDYDLILAMDIENLRELTSMTPSPEHLSKLRLMRDYDPEAGPKSSVPDPYYGGEDGFERTYRIVERSIRGLLEALEREET